MEQLRVGGGGRGDDASRQQVNAAVLVQTVMPYHSVTLLVQTLRRL